MTALLIAGATGLVGGHTLSLALADDRVSRVVAPTRRPLPDHPKLTNPVVDFAALPGDADWWRVDGVVCGLGTTMRQAGSREAFRFVDHELVLATARATRSAGATAFTVVSSVGADPRSRFFYLRVKGEMERDLAGCDFPSTTVLRPSLLLGARDRDESWFNNATMALNRWAAPVLPQKWRPVDGRVVAELALESAVAPVPGHRVVSLPS